MSEVRSVWMVPRQIAGPMGRAYLMLPCKHQRAAIRYPFRPVVRRCRVCDVRYQVTVREGEETAQVVRLSA